MSTVFSSVKPTSPEASSKASAVVSGTSDNSLFSAFFAPFRLFRLAAHRKYYSQKRQKTPRRRKNHRLIGIVQAVSHDLRHHEQRYAEHEQDERGFIKEIHFPLFFFLTHNDLTSSRLLPQNHQDRAVRLAPSAKLPPFRAHRGQSPYQATAPSSGSLRSPFCAAKTPPSQP